MHLNSSSLPITDVRIREQLGRAICLTGTARSGTTLIGTLIHSMQGVEYSFEPPTLVMLFLLLDRIPADAWKLMYEAYLFEELLVNGLGGRFMNLNPHDDSSILHAKPMVEIFGRFEKSCAYGELFDEALKRTVAYKIPDIVSRIPLLRKVYPETRVLAMVRHPDPVVNSIERKGWYSSPEWTYRDNGITREVDGQIVSAWMPEKDGPEWMGLSPVDRAYRFYTRMYEPLLNDPQSIIVNYESLMQRPAEVTAQICERLALKPGAKTEQIISNVRERSPRDVVPEGFTKTYRDEALEVHRQCARLAI